MYLNLLTLIITTVAVSSNYSLLLLVGITAAWTVIPVQLSCVATTDNQAEFSAGVVRAANSLRMVATLTVDKYGPTVRKIIRQLNTINSLRISFFNTAASITRTRTISAA